MVCSSLTVHLICGEVVPFYSKPVVLKFLEGDWCHLDHFCDYLDTLGPTPTTFPGPFLVLDIWLISPVAYSASIYCPCHLHTLYMALKCQTCTRTIPSLTHTKIHKFPLVPLTPQITSYKHLIISLHTSQITLPFIRQLQTIPANTSINDSPSPKFPILSDTNYHDWAFNIVRE